MRTGFLKELRGYYTPGNLSEEQRERYQEVRRKLKDALLVIERLDFYRPPIPLDD